MLSPLIILLLSASPAARSGAPAPVAARVAAQRVSECGLGRVAARFDAELDEDILVASEAGSATDSQLACADRAAGFYSLELPAKVQKRFDAMRNARLAVAARAQARAWISAHGLAGRVPQYRKGVDDDAAFARRIERLCGRQARGAFQSRYGPHALSPDWAMRHLQNRRAQSAVECLMNATTVAGFELFFIGNEAYAPSKPR